MNNFFKKAWPDVAAIALFVVLSCAYFYPSAIDGRVLTGSDHTGGVGLGAELEHYKTETGETARWTNAGFSGMPTYQINPTYPSVSLLRGISDVYKLGLGEYVGLVFIMLLGFYILMRAFNFKPWMAALGAIVWAFSSYYFVLILAGHIWKFITLAYIPPTIAGLVLAYRGKYLWGGLLTAFFMALQILSNHVQMSYYFGFVMLAMIVGYFFEALKQKQLPRFFKATGVVIVASLIGVMLNTTNLYHTYEYSKYTMRAASELKKQNATNQTSSGLERDYITQWSYGIGETFTLMIPNAKGGASVPMAANEQAMKDANPTYASLYQQIGQYWGEQPSTSGPVYVGAFVCFLFILGLFLVKGPMKWAILGVTILSILLSWGKNFMGFTDLFIDYFPMYAKFRTVASILVIAEFTMPLLALMALKEWINPSNENLNKAGKRELKPFYISLGVTAGLCFFFAVMPSLFFDSFVSSTEMNALQAGIPADQLSPIIADITHVREGLFTSDAWRSFFIIIIGAGLMFAYAKGKLKSIPLVGAIIALCLFDMWNVNKRYLNDGCFVEPSAQITVQKTAADEQILADKSLDYRVLDLSSNTFNDNSAAFFHKSIGGYHPAKLRRYQEMIEYHITPEMSYLYKTIATSQGDLSALSVDSVRVLDMLNTKYIILGLQNGQKAAVQNPKAFGNAWFVQQINYVQTANEEIEGLYHFDPHAVAIANEQYKTALGSTTNYVADSTASIQLISYAPNKLVYQTNAKNAQVALFAEIYYPDWQAFIDGKEVPIACANYILRALQVPAGSHTIEFRFDPQSIKATEKIAYTGLAILFLGAFLGGGMFLLRKRKKNNK